jgi:transcriptional regulator with XRE-family HTH domain
MASTLRSPQHEALRRFIIQQRRAARLTQTEVAAKLGRPQPYIANIERGQRRVDVVELIELAAAIGFDPLEAVRVAQTRRR